MVSYLPQMHNNWYGRLKTPASTMSTILLKIQGIIFGRVERFLRPVLCIINLNQERTYVTALQTLLGRSCFRQWSQLHSDRQARSNQVHLLFDGKHRRSRCGTMVHRSFKAKPRSGHRQQRSRDAFGVLRDEVGQRCFQCRKQGGSLRHSRQCRRDHLHQRTPDRHGPGVENRKRLHHGCLTATATEIIEYAPRSISRIPRRTAPQTQTGRIPEDHRPTPQIDG